MNDENRKEIYIVVFFVDFDKVLKVNVVLDFLKFFWKEIEEDLLYVIEILF